jgi:hypothetical protein
LVRWPRTADRAGSSRAIFTSTGEVLRKIGIIDASVDIRETLDSWIDGSYLGSAG